MTMFSGYRKILGFASVVGAAVFLLQASPASAQSTCSSLSQKQCGNQSSCVWVKGYKAKSGKAVKAYCRGKPSKGAAKKSGESKVKSAKKTAGEKAASPSRKGTKKTLSKKKVSAGSKRLKGKAKSLKSKSVKAKTVSTKATKADLKSKAVTDKASKKFTPNSKK